MKTVVVLNQFALPRSEGGGTRHIDLFSRVESWNTVIVAGNRNHYTQAAFVTSDTRFHLVAVPDQKDNGLMRAVGWLVYSIQTLLYVTTRRNLDLVYGSSPHLLAPLAGLLAARIRRVPFVLEVRDLWPESIVSAGKMRTGSVLFRIFSRVERILVRSADHIVVVTPGWEDHFARLGADSSRITVIPNGTEAHDFEVAKSKDELRTEQNIVGFTAIFAGAHGPKDGIDLILESARALPNVNFLLIGAGSQKASAQRIVLEERISNVKFRSTVPKSRLGEVLTACDVGLHVVSPLSVFNKGMSPNKLFDYLACGLPVVSNAEVGLRAILADGDCGALGDSASLTDGIRKVMMATAEERRDWGIAGKELIENRFSRRSAASALETVMNSTAGA